ncbi:hypothetical protein ACQPYE_26665 [Actinosynnema sp. CA-299493]
MLVYPSAIDLSSADAAEDDLDARVGEDGVEQGGKLPVTVSDQEPHVLALVFEVYDEVSGGLGDPGRGRVRGGAQDPDSVAGPPRQPTGNRSLSIQ